MGPPKLEQHQDSGNDAAHAAHNRNPARQRHTAQRQSCQYQEDREKKPFHVRLSFIKTVLVTSKATGGWEGPATTYNQTRPNTRAEIRSFQLIFQQEMDSRPSLKMGSGPHS